MTNKIRVDQLLRFRCECGAEAAVTIDVPQAPDRSVEHAAAVARLDLQAASLKIQRERIVVIDADRAQLDARLKATFDAGIDQQKLANDRANRIAVLEGDKAELAKRLDAVVAEADKQKEIAHEFRSRATRMDTAIRTALSHLDGLTGAASSHVKGVLRQALGIEPKQSTTAPPGEC